MIMSTSVVVASQSAANNTESWTRHTHAWTESCCSLCGALSLLFITSFTKRHCPVTVQQLMAMSNCA